MEQLEHGGYMQAPEKVNLKIYQGATFTEVLRWESYVKSYAPITAISKTAPVVLTSTAHGIPLGWRVKIKSVQGMKEINSDEYVYITDSDANSITIGDINATQYTTYTSGGVIEYNTPKSLAGLTARMQIRSKVTSTDIILELTTENGMIIINDTLKTITLTIPAATTSGLTFKTGVYSLELVSGTEVTAFIQGSVTLGTEITR